LPHIYYYNAPTRIYIYIIREDPAVFEATGKWNETFRNLRE